MCFWCPWFSSAAKPPPTLQLHPIHHSLPPRHKERDHVVAFFVSGMLLTPHGSPLVPHPPNMQNTPTRACFLCSAPPLSSLTHRTCKTRPGGACFVCSARLASPLVPHAPPLSSRTPSCLSCAEHQIQAHGGPVFDVRRVMALPYPPKTKNMPPGRVFCVRCVPISSPSAEHKQHASGACLSCSARPQTSPTRRTRVTPP